MEVIYDRSVDAAYIYLVSVIGEGQVKKTYTCNPKEVNGQINIDFDAWGKLLGIEILNASRFLSEQLLKEAEIIE